MLKFLILFSVLLGVSCAFDGIIYDFVVPLKYEGSSHKGYVKGQMGFYVSDSEIQIKGMKSKTYANHSGNEIVTHTKKCVFHRENGSLSGQDQFFLDYMNLKINGFGFNWNLSTQYLVIKKKVTVDATSVVN